MLGLGKDSLRGEDSAGREVPNSVLAIGSPFGSMRGKGNCFRHDWKWPRSTWLYWLFFLFCISYNRNLNLSLTIFLNPFHDSTEVAERKIIVRRYILDLEVEHGLTEL